MSNPVVEHLKKIFPFWSNLEEAFFYFLSLLFMDKKDKNINNQFSPEEIWGLFLEELDHLFNKKGVHLDYALSTACANVFCKTNVYVLDDTDFFVFNYHDVIFEKIKNRYLELLDNYFNVGSYDFKTACKIAKDHVLEEMHVPENLFEKLKEEFDFNEKQIIDAV